MKRSISHSNSESNVGITEVIMTDDNTGLGMVLPMLSHLSHSSEDKWFTWIAPQKVSKTRLISYDFAMSNIRFIHTENESESLWVFWDALANGNSANVVANINTLSESERKTLENASILGNTRGLVLRSRN